MTLPATMKAMVTMGHGDLNQMVLHTDWPRPEPASNEVLIKVGACGLNNTDVNTRSGWYSKTVNDATTGGAFEVVGEDDPTWGGAPLKFPLIQGADVCGKIVAVGAEVNPSRIGERIITDGWLRDTKEPENMNKVGYFGSERDGGFAEYTTTPARNALVVTSDLSDAELATFSCSYSTAEGMLTPGSGWARRYRPNTRCIWWRRRCTCPTRQAARRARDCDGVRHETQRRRGPFPG